MCGSPSHRKAVLDEREGARDKLLQLVIERYSGLVGSQICEDILNSAKNANTLRNGNKFRRPERAMGAVLAREVPSSVHRYEGVAIDTPLPRRYVRLGREVFAANKVDASYNFSEVSSTKQKPDWYSPGAGKFTQADADLQVVMDAYQRSDWAILDTAWEGLFCCAGHQMLIKLPGGHEWMLALYHWPDSAVFVWPVALTPVPGHPSDRFIQLQSRLQQPALVTVTNIEHVKAMPFVWRSPCWQMQKFKKAPSEWCMAVRPFPAGDGKDSLLKVAAQNAFWMVDKTSLERLVRSRGLPLPPGRSLFETIVALVEKYAGGGTAEEVLAIAAKRLAKMRSADSWTEGILEVDDAVECLDHHDHKVVDNEKKNALDRKAELEDFRKDYRQKASQVHSSKDSAGRKRSRQGAASSSSSSNSPAFPARLPPISTIAHGDAKRYAPPGAFVWRSLVSGAWQGHLQPYARCGRSWARYGEHEALRLVLADLWDKWLDGQGKGRSDCPIAGIFDGPDGAFRVGASAAASSSG